MCVIWLWTIEEVRPYLRLYSWWFSNNSQKWFLSNSVIFYLFMVIVEWFLINSQWFSAILKPFSNDSQAILESQQFLSDFQTILKWFLAIFSDSQNILKWFLSDSPMILEWFAMILEPFSSDPQTFSNDSHDIHSNSQFSNDSWQFSSDS